MTTNNNKNLKKHTSALMKKKIASSSITAAILEWLRRSGVTKVLLKVKKLFLYDYA